MQLTKELTPCACWTVWRWLPGREGWRLPEPFFTWLRVSLHYLQLVEHIMSLYTVISVPRGIEQNVQVVSLYISLWGYLFVSRNVCWVQLWGGGAVLDEIQHISAAGCGDPLCSGRAAQHGDWVCSSSVFWPHISHPKWIFFSSQNVCYYTLLFFQKWYSLLNRLKHCQTKVNKDQICRLTLQSYNFRHFLLKLSN